MPKILKFCDSCSIYTMNEKKCPKCDGVVRTPHPPKFSPQDKYQRYRIQFFKDKFSKNN
ncbi:MAG: RNA-protein complex protein Nop10 [archaeon]|nr:RNA-protein complex protein Nop10 [archaeon]